MFNDEEIKILEQRGYIYDKEKNIFIQNNCYQLDLNNSNDMNELQSVIDSYYRIKWEEENGIEIFEQPNVTTEKEIKFIKKERTKEILPTHKNVMQNISSWQYNFLIMLICKSNFNKEGDKMEAYIYEKDLKDKLNELRQEGIKVPSRNSIKIYLNVLSEITFENNTKLVTKENTPNGLVYKIQQNYEGKYFTTIPREQLNELLKATNKNVLKCYCIIKYTIEGNKNKYTPITREYLVRHMGLTEGEASENYISTIINALRKLGHIKIKIEHLKEIDKQGNIISKDKNYYQLTTLEEWKEITKNIGYIKK